jgi:hypothetical protein
MASTNTPEYQTQNFNIYNVSQNWPNVGYIGLYLQNNFDTSKNSNFAWQYNNVLHQIEVKIN